MRWPTSQDLQNKPENLLKVLNEIDGFLSDYDETLLNYHKGFLYYQQGEYKKCVDLLEGALEITSNHLVSIELLAEAYMAMKAYKKAEHYLGLAIDKGWGRPEIYKLKSKIRFLLNDDESALYNINKVLEQQTSLDDLLLKSQILISKKDTLEAMRLFEILKNIDSSDWRVKNVKYQIDTLNGDFVEEKELISDEEKNKPIDVLELIRLFESKGNIKAEIKILEKYYSKHLDDLNIGKILCEKYIKDNQLYKAKKILHIMKEKSIGDADLEQLDNALYEKIGRMKILR